MPKFCPKCGKENDDDATFCIICGTRLSGINSTSTDNEKNRNNNLLLIAIVVLLIIIAIIGTFAFIGWNDNFNTVVVSSNGSSSDASSSKTWHKIDSFNGVGDYTITLNSGGNPTRIVSSAMPLINYADNFMLTTVSKNGQTVGSSQLSWGSDSALTKKSDTIEFTGSGTYNIYISTYELDYWNLEIYEYY